MTRRIFVLGLTGSIGMGKSTTAGFFRARGIPVWDADAAVHRLYAAGGRAVDGIRAICPQAVGSSGVDRAVLKQWIAKDRDAIRKIEAVVHPLVAEDRADFIEQATLGGARLVVVDVPLLFETGGNRKVDASLVVSAPAEVQRQRVLGRSGMTEDHFERILASQMPDAEKRRLADFIIETTTLDQAEAAVEKIIAEIENRIDAHA